MRWGEQRAGANGGAPTLARLAPLIGEASEVPKAPEASPTSPSEEASLGTLASQAEAHGSSCHLSS